MNRVLRLSSVPLVLALAACGGTGDATPNGSDSSFANPGAGGSGGAAGAGAHAASGGTGGSGNAPSFGGSSGGPTTCSASDADMDTIADHLEGADATPPTDTDGDGTPDFQDTDSDDDGFPDSVEAVACGKPVMRTDVCVPAVDTDMDGVGDYRDLDSDNDGVPDADERAYDPDGSKCCRTLPDCDGDGWPDIVESAAMTSPTDATSKPPDSYLYFVLPYGKPEQTKDFTFSTGVKIADIYFLIDPTASMQPSIDNVKASIDSTIIPTILNGDPNATPPIPAIPGANVGIGSFRDVPWLPYGQPGDDVYANGATLAPPQGMAPNFTAPAGVSSFLSSLTAGGGGDGPEGWTQALWMATTGMPYSVTGAGSWNGPSPSCSDASLAGIPCFRPNSLPVFVLVTDAPAHQGPDPTHDYDPSTVTGAVPYQTVVDALNATGAKIVGVPVDNGSGGAARPDLTDLATKTGSVYHDPAFGGSDVPLVNTTDVMASAVSNEVVRLIGLLAGQGQHNVTTVRQNYSCAGGVDCDGDGNPDPAYQNPSIPAGGPPFDATQLITAVTPVDSTDTPLPYDSIDATTFYGVHGDAQVTFRVHAQNSVLNPQTLVVVRALIRVRTPNGQDLGGAAGVKSVFFLIPRNPQIMK